MIAQTHRFAKRKMNITCLDDLDDGRHGHHEPPLGWRPPKHIPKKVVKQRKPHAGLDPDQYSHAEFLRSILPWYSEHKTTRLYFGGTPLRVPLAFAPLSTRILIPPGYAVSPCGVFEVLENKEQSHRKDHIEIEGYNLMMVCEKPIFIEHLHIDYDESGMMDVVFGRVTWYQRETKQWVNLTINMKDFSDGESIVKLQRLGLPVMIRTRHRLARYLSACFKTNKDALRESRLLFRVKYGQKLISKKLYYRPLREFTVVE